ncbi:MAG: hypothetical protein RJQ00_02620 [Vicingaceae bacterium]
MTQNIHIEKLTLIGFRKNYEIQFKEGLNIITGPISTGKSAILELINYALGSKKHKEYLEVKSSCTDVLLDIRIRGVKYRISRPLFFFTRPVKLYKWDAESGSFPENFDIVEIDSPANEKSLSSFLLSELQVPELTIANQTFSFRDIFTYSYLSQPKIDQENLLDENNPQKSFKRKPTLEIIFNSLNQLLQELKEAKKNKKEQLDKFYDKKKAVLDFIRSVELYNTNEENANIRIELLEAKEKLKNELDDLKNRSKNSDTRTRSLEAKLFLIREEQKRLYAQVVELEKYKEKLNLLRNQYGNELIKLDYLLIANGKLQKIDFTICPSCSNELSDPDFGKCKLCGNDLQEFDEEEEKAIRLERKRLNTKISGLIDFIDQQEREIDNLNSQISKNASASKVVEDNIDSIQRVYISPFLERIEQLNREMGEIDGKLEMLEKYERVRMELNDIAEEIEREEEKFKAIENQIKEIEDGREGFDELLDVFSSKFSKSLQEFSFPKLTDAFIDKKSYLPYVRNVRYNDIGSGGAQTLISIAYYLSVLKVSIELKRTYHTGILLMDTISKNLGTGNEDAKIQDEFKDIKIFKSLFNHLVMFSNQNSERFQLIIVNNVLPDGLNEENVIVRFDQDGTRGIPYGLIDDIVVNPNQGELLNE